MHIEVTQDEWNRRNDIDSDITSRAYLLLNVDWVSYSSWIDDELKLIVFVKNNLVDKDGTDGVIAAWVNDESMAVGVDISPM